MANPVAVAVANPVAVAVANPVAVAVANPVAVAVAVAVAVKTVDPEPRGLQHRAEPWGRVLPSVSSWSLE